MGEKIRVGIVGYGNLGKGAEQAVKASPDLELVKLFDKRSDTQLEEMRAYLGKIDFMLLCIGSSVDLPLQTPAVASLFNTVDSFDTHAEIPGYFSAVDEAAKKAGTISMISTGWDPGLFSIMRGLFSAVLPEGKTNTFWGRGVSQGHGEAIKRLPGAVIARSYTIPVEATLEAVKNGDSSDFTPRQMHKRDCYVVPEEGADLEELKRQIVSMPNYFEPYDTSVTFIDRETFDREHGALPHGGSVLRSGYTGTAQTPQGIEFGLRLGSNPEFTASAMVCFCRAAWRMHQEGRRGAVTVFDTPIGYLSTMDDAQLRQEML